jgi:hypothetical protein
MLQKQRKVLYAARSKKKGFGKSRKAKLSEGVVRENTKRDRRNERARKHFSLACEKRMSKDNFFTSNGVSQFTDPESSLSLGLQTAPWPSKYKLVSLSKYNGYGHFI